MTATRYHSLIVSENDLPADLEVTAHTREKDGTRVIMGLRHRRFPVEGCNSIPRAFSLPTARTGREFSKAVVFSRLQLETGSSHFNCPQ